MTDRWTAETEELVARALSGIATSRGYRLYTERFELADAALTAIADAGLLLAPGGETREEWGVAVTDHPDEVWPVESEDRARTRAARLNVGLYRRTVTVHVGPWLPVDDGGGA